VSINEIGNPALVALPLPETCSQPEKLGSERSDAVHPEGGAE
jgi:hypothetical protein